VELVDETFEVYVLPQELFNSKKLIEEKGMAVSSAEIILDPITMVDVSAEDSQKLNLLLEKLQDMDDVQKVFTNAHLI
jgi:transcriptional/translational regulatory protein YebC/TACO1